MMKRKRIEWRRRIFPSAASWVAPAVLVAPVFLVAPNGEVAGQTPPPVEAPAFATDPTAAVEQLFQGMRTADTTMVRSVLADDVRFAILDTSGDRSRIVTRTADGWVEAIGGSGGSWDERIYEVDVRRDGPMASVWAPYTFYRGETISHCGINSIELLRDDEGWKITQVSDTRRQDACPDPLRSSPGSPR